MSAAQKYDDDFMSLLSTQREILKRLNKEKSSRAKECELESTGQTGELAKNFPSTSTKHLQFDEVSDPFYLMNEPIIERRLGQDGVRHKTKSRRISGNFDAISTCNTQSSTDFTRDERRNKKAKMSQKKYFRMDGSLIGKGKSEHRNRIRGRLANALVFDVDSTAARLQHGIDPLNTKQLKSNFFANNTKESSYNRVDRIGCNIDLATLKGEFENFVLAMEKSMKSQQDIHDWDRRMGLKRSHSKTMRLSMRSRNKLRKVINV